MSFQYKIWTKSTCAPTYAVNAREYLQFLSWKELLEKKKDFRYYLQWLVFEEVAKNKKNKEIEWVTHQLF